MTTTNTTTLSDGSVATYSEIRRMVFKADLVTGGGAPSVDAQVDAEIKRLMRANGRGYSENLALLRTVNPKLISAWVKESKERK